MALPPGYVDELTITLSVDREAADNARQTEEKTIAREARIAKWRASNNRTLAKQGLRPAH